MIWPFKMFFLSTTVKYILDALITIDKILSKTLKCLVMTKLTSHSFQKHLVNVYLENIFIIIKNDREPVFIIYF